MPEETNKPRPARRRARKADGQFKGDDPATPDVNEAWEATEMETSVGEKTAGKYGVRQKVATSGSTAGKYSNKKAQAVRPTFGTVTSKTY